MRPTPATGYKKTGSMKDIRRLYVAVILRALRDLTFKSQYGDKSEEKAIQMKAEIFLTSQIKSIVEDREKVFHLAGISTNLIPKMMIFAKTSPRALDKVAYSLFVDAHAGDETKNAGVDTVAGEKVV